MKIDLCRLFGVEEGEEFKVDRGVNYPRNNTYFVKNNILLYKNEQAGVVIEESNLGINNLNQIKEIIKQKKKKQFTDDELCILRNIDKKYKWIARDKVDRDEYDNYGNLNIYLGEPNKSTVSWLPSDEYCEFHAYNHLFQSIKWEDNEPIYIDDYVNRQNEVK